MEVPGLLIPADRSEPITKTKFDLDKISQYEVRQFDRGTLFLTEKYADLDHLTSNPAATDYTKRHSDAAKYPDSQLDPPDDLYGPVIAVSYDTLFEMITDLTGQLTRLKHTLELMDPLRKSD